MREVSKDEFFRIINEEHLDVITESKRIDCGVYESTYMFRDRRAYGKVIPEKDLDRYPYYVKHYYIY